MNFGNIAQGFGQAADSLYGYNKGLQDTDQEKQKFDLYKNSMKLDIDTKNLELKKAEHEYNIKNTPVHISTLTQNPDIINMVYSLGATDENGMIAPVNWDKTRKNILEDDTMRTHLFESKKQKWTEDSMSNDPTVSSQAIENLKKLGEVEMQANPQYMQQSKIKQMELDAAKEKPSFKAPLPMTDKGFTISVDANGINTANWQAPDGKNMSAPYNPEIHGRPYKVDQEKKDSFSTWTPEAKIQEYMLHMITGKPPVSAAGMGGNDRQAYAKGYAQWKVDSNITPRDIALMQADYRAGDMTLKNMSKQEAPTSAFVMNINRQIEKVQSLYQNNDRTGIRLIDLPIRTLKVKALGSGDEAVKASYLLEISNEIGKLSSGASASVQQLSDSAKEDWEKVHDPNLSLSEIMKVVNATRDQANMRLETWKAAKETVRSEIRMIGGEQAGATNQPEVPATSWSHGKPVPQGYKEQFNPDTKQYRIVPK